MGVKADELGERLAALDQWAAGPAQRATIPDERPHVLRPRAQRLVDPGGQLVPDSQVEEPGRGREHDRHGEREDKRETQADG